mmetsp:Transcript_46477/g.116879  ORF Transcript_46477/g.116879 Transcript_46477/m.116879 type:complete len:215 (+) Transcript_46477:1291-1935(+)
MLTIQLGVLPLDRIHHRLLQHSPQQGVGAQYVSDVATIHLVCLLFSLLHERGEERLLRDAGTHLAEDAVGGDGGRHVVAVHVGGHLLGLLVQGLKQGLGRPPVEHRIRVQTIRHAHGVQLRRHGLRTLAERPDGLVQGFLTGAFAQRGEGVQAVGNLLSCHRRGQVHHAICKGHQQLHPGVLPYPCKCSQDARHVLCRHLWHDRFRALRQRGEE